MTKGRLEAFTDGVIAVVITIMVLELKTPHEATWTALLQNWPVFLSYVLSFMFVGIFWVNHHHMLHTAKHVNGKVLWANLHLLFWISLFPFVTSWLDEATPVPAPLPTALYGFVLLMAGLAWIPVQRALIAVNGGNEGELAQAVGAGWKEHLTLAIDVVAIALAFFVPAVSCLLYFAVAMIWFVPDRRIESRLHP